MLRGQLIEREALLRVLQDPGFTDLVEAAREMVAEERWQRQAQLADKHRSLIFASQGTITCFSSSFPGVVIIIISSSSIFVIIIIIIIIVCLHHHYHHNCHYHHQQQTRQCQVGAGIWPSS
jgi:hypothetical protein